MATTTVDVGSDHDIDIDLDVSLPLYCSYSDCYGSRFNYLGLLGKLAWWRCKACGGDFATNA